MLTRPYYPLHQIRRSLHTKGGEFYTEDGTVYTGLYHILPTEQAFTGAIPVKESVELFPLKGNIAQAKFYRKNTNIRTGNYESPVYYLAKPSGDEINNGYMIRYFVQKRTSPLSTIIEVDRDQFSSVNTINGPGINGAIWNKVFLHWNIRGSNTKAMIEVNRQTLFKYETNFPGISNYLNNLLEYAM